MKNIRSKVIAMVLIVSVALCSAACGLGPSVESEGDETKTILRIGNYYSGLRDEYLTAVERSFEEKYAETSFEEGKTGVDIVIDNSGSYSAQTVIDNYDKNDVWISYQIDYYEIASRGLGLDITDVVTGDLGDVSTGESGVTIESKMDSDLKDTFKAIGNGKYYGLPLYEQYYGIVFDVDLFEREGFYFAKGYDRNGDLADMFVTSATDERSVGPDGREGTYDDGLPETYEDFYNLCRYMKTFNVIPMSYPGQFMHYWTRYLFQVWADYEGAEQMTLNFSLNGTAADLVDIANDGTLTPKDDVNVTPANSYELQKQAGKYYALQFAKTLATNNNWFSSSSRATGQSQELNQKEFLYSRQMTSPIAMCLDGCWFNAEANSAYVDMVNAGDVTAGRYTRKIGFMPIPKATADKVGEDLTFVDSSRSICFISSRVSGAKETVAKLFMKYFHTNDSLAVWTEKTETTRPFTYTVDSSKLSHFGNMMMEIHNNSNVVFPYSTERVYLQNSSIFTLDSWAFTSSNGYSHPFTIFRDRTNVTVKDYFNGMYSTTRAQIETLIG